MDTDTLVRALLIILAGGILQGTVAFGFGLLSVPLLMSTGIPVPVVLAMVSICTAVQSLSGVHHLRHAVPWKPVGVSLVVRATTMVLGVWVLRILAGYPISSLKFWVGAVMLLSVVGQAFWHPLPRPELHRGWDLTAFLVSGFTGGLCSMGGPPLVLWVMAHDWTTDRIRAFLFASFMSLVPFQLFLLHVNFGSEVFRGITLGLMLSPAVLAGSLIGLRIGGRFSKRVLRLLAYLVLTLIALNAMYPQVRQWLAYGIPN